MPIAEGSIDRPYRRKTVFCGDGGSGKTSLLTRILNPELELDLNRYEPTIFETHVWTPKAVSPNKNLLLELWDTAGQEDYDRLRALSYTDTHLVLMCYAVNDPTSLENIESKWWPEVAHHCPGAKLALVALKCDLRNENKTIQKLATDGQTTIGFEAGLAMAKRIGASRYFETSSRTNQGVQEAFEELATVALAQVLAEKKDEGFNCFGCI